VRITNSRSPEATVEASRVNNKNTADDHESASFSAVMHDQTSLGAIATALQPSESSNARVAELRKQFLNGSYQVDAASLSRKIVSDHIGPPIP
jgi:anti-sigma28 factor (negative regulator of flagellin synthesis)